MMRSEEPTANLLPYGDHAHTVAAALILKSTNVGLYSPSFSAYSHTKAFASCEHVKILALSGEMSTEVTVLSWPRSTVTNCGLAPPTRYNSTVLALATATSVRSDENTWSLMGVWPKLYTIGEGIQESTLAKVRNANATFIFYCRYLVLASLALDDALGLVPVVEHLVVLDLGLDDAVEPLDDGREHHGGFLVVEDPEPVEQPVQHQAVARGVSEQERAHQQVDDQHELVVGDQQREQCAAVQHGGDALVAQKAQHRDEKERDDLQHQLERQTPHERQHREAEIALRHERRRLGEIRQAELVGRGGHERRHRAHQREPVADGVDVPLVGQPEHAENQRNGAKADAHKVPGQPRAVLQFGRRLALVDQLLGLEVRRHRVVGVDRAAVVLGLGNVWHG